MKLLKALATTAFAAGIAVAGPAQAGLRDTYNQGNQKDYAETARCVRLLNQTSFKGNWSDNPKSGYLIRTRDNAIFRHEARIADHADGTPGVRCKTKFVGYLGRSYNYDCNYGFKCITEWHVEGGMLTSYEGFANADGSFNSGTRPGDKSPTRSQYPRMTYGHGLEQFVR